MDRHPQSEVAANRRDWSAVATFFPYVAALAMVALSSIAGTFIAPRWGNSAVDLLYLPTILASATFFGLWPALVAGLASALAYNFFFTPPFHTLRMDRPADIVTVVVLFLVATVTSKLAADVREQAALATAHSNRNATAAGFAARLLSCSEKRQIAAVACDELSQIFDCNVAIVEGLPQPTMVASAPSKLPLTSKRHRDGGDGASFGRSSGPRVPPSVSHRLAIPRRAPVEGHCRRGRLRSGR